MDDLEQEFGPTSSVTLSNTAPSSSSHHQDVRRLDNNKTSPKAAPDKLAFFAHHPSTSSVDRPVAVSAMSSVTDPSERSEPQYIRRFGHRHAPTPVVSHNLPTEDTSEEASPSSPTSSVDIITEATTRPSDARPSADDRLIDTASDTSEVESNHHDTSDDAVAGQGQLSSNTESIDSDPQKYHPAEAHTIDQPREGSPKMNDGLGHIEQPANPSLRSERPDEAEENEGDDEDDENDDNNYNPANNRFYTPSNRQTKPLSGDDSHSSEAEPKTTHSAVRPTSQQPVRHPTSGLHQQSQSQFPDTGNLARKLQAWREQDTDRYNEFIAMVENQCRLQEDKKRLMTENRDLRLEVAHLRSIINGNDLEHPIDTTSENPSSRNISHLDSPTGHHHLDSPTGHRRLDSSNDYHLDDSYGGDASFEYDPNVPRPAFDDHSYASNANIPHVRNKWQSKEDKKALRIGTKVDDWQEVSRRKNGGGSTRNPRLNGPNLGAYNNKTSPMRNIKALLYDAEGLRVDPPPPKPQDPASLHKIWNMNNEQRFCHSDIRGR
ncbi:MAG: hypothetical protein OHK93_000835 [Ramalina farinacea]|uniref:Uncharacterized protein n=1 Tax=Ramalina farinacea TaxID=258253 RepID=A0AA43QRN1_9LECA|nr:hypothetical protein [Ramalina farinacea]